MITIYPGILLIRAWRTSEQRSLFFAGHVFVLPGGFSRVSQVLLFSVTMSREKNHVTPFFCVTMSHDKILLCACAWQKLPSWAKGTKFLLYIFLQCMLHRSKMPSSLFSYWRVQKKMPDPTGPFTVGCTDYMCAENESFGEKNAGSFIRFFYPVQKTAGPIDESKCCFWMPREEYTTGLLKFMKLPVWLLSKFFYWTVGELSFEYLTLSRNEMKFKSRERVS